MSIPLLPGLKDSNKIAIPQRGTWTSSVQNTLSNLVEDLKVGTDVASDISSIPDLWARPALYELALFNKEHYLHNRYLAEWRGIMAMLALRVLQNLNDLKLETIQVKDYNQLTQDDPEFMKVISKLIPDTYIKNPDPTLTSGCVAKIQILLCKDTPLAIFWPDTFICPAFGLNTRKNLVPWWDFDGVKDPISYLSDKEKGMLTFWLQKIIDTIPAAKDPKRDKLIGLLSDFVKDLKVNPITYKGVAPGLGITGFCHCVDEPIIPTVTASFLDNSQIKLVNQKGNNAKTLLILSTDMAKQWNIAENDIIVAGHVNLGAVLPKYTGVVLDQNKDDLNGVDLKQYNAEKRMANEFFTDRIAVIYSGINSFPNTINNKIYNLESFPVNILLPIKQELLDYLDVQYLVQHVEIKPVGEDIQVSLSLPLAGPDDEIKFLVTTKTYHNKKEEIQKYDFLPLLQIWPNFVLDDPNKWTAYYSYYDSCQQNTFYAAPLMKDMEVRPIQSGQAEIVRGKDFPEAYVCYNVEEKATGRENVAIGLILLDKPKSRPSIANNKVCTIGIDFGTTNTVAYISENESNPKLLTMNNRMFNVVNNDPAGLKVESKDELRRKFLSTCEQPHAPATSIRTMFHSYYGSFDGDINQPLFRGNIYLLEDSDNIIKDSKMDPGLIGNIHTDDMKWNAVQGIENKQGFLMQLCMQCMAEAVDNDANSIRWIYSYPSSFSKRQKDDYTALWNNTLIKELKKICSLNTMIPEEEKESIAMAGYFAKDMNATGNRGFVCLDIGGGSTDLAIWQGTNNQVRYQTSLRFAGRDILNRYLWNKKQNNHYLLDALKNNNEKFNAQIEALHDVSDNSTFNLELEALLKYYEDIIINTLLPKFQLPDVALMIRDISFSLSGIFFYSGILVGYLKKNHNYDEEKLLPNCYVGGNGSKLLNWVVPGVFTSENHINDVFRACFMDGVEIGMGDMEADIDDYFDVYKTDKAKQEVAYGLVCDRFVSKPDPSEHRVVRVSQQKHVDDSIVAGEKFIIKNADTEKADIITQQNIIDIVQVDTDCPVFNKFLEEFNFQIKTLGYPEIEINKKDKINICSQVNQILVDKAKDAAKDKDKVELEPLFVILLKTVLDYLSKK